MHLLTANIADKKEHFNRIAVLIFFAWVAIIFTTPVGEGDFFWHVKTGEWIWHHKALPASDPFSFTVKEFNPFNPESGRIPFLLKQYWLGQLIFYGIWNVANEAGMVIFRAACYTGILIFLFRWAKKFQEGALPLLTVVLVGNVLRNYSNERPQIFAFLLMPLLVYTLEELRTSHRIKPPSWPAIALPLIMLFWANCHASFMLGIVVIAVYAVSHLIERIKCHKPLNKREIILFTTSALITLINPNGYNAFKEFFSLSKNYTNLVAEFTSPVKLAYQYHIFDYSYCFLLAAATLTIILCFKKMATAHLLLISALAGLSLTATRYIPFFVIVAPILCIYTPKWQMNRLLRFLPLLIVLLLVGTADYRNVLKFRAERAFPEKASRFLKEVKPRGNMFNYISWGGYLMCYNNYPIFIDGRTLVEELLPIHNSVLAGQNWESTLAGYGINFMIIPGTDTISMQAYPLLLQLLRNDEWSLIYKDEVALILIKNSADNTDIINRYALDKSIMSSHIQDRWKWQQNSDF